MNTPLGWARANIVYEKMIGPPKPGTLAEVLCIMIWKARQSMGIAQARALAQASLGGDKAVDAFSEYRDLVNRVEIKERTDKMRERLSAMQDIKEIRFKPLDDMRNRGPTLKTVSREKVLPKIPEKYRLRPVQRSRPKTRKEG